MRYFSGLDAEAYDRSYTDRELAVRMFAYFKPHARRLLIISVALVVIAAAGAGSPLIVSRGVDMIANAESTHLIPLLAAAMLLIGVVIWGANWVRRRLTSRAVAEVMMQLREDAFASAAAHDLSFYDEHPSGRIVSRITSDTQEFAQVVVLITDLLNQAVQASILLFVLLGIEWRLTALLLVMLPFVFGFSIGFRRLARRVTRKGMRAMANVNAAIKESVTGISVAKNFRQERSIFDEFEKINQQSYQMNVRRGLVLSLVFPSLNGLGGIATAILVYSGGVSVSQAIISIGAWYLFINSLNQFWFPILNLSAFSSQIQGGLSAAERVFALIDAESAVIQKSENSIDHLEGRIEFREVCFQYKPGEPVLQHFNLQIKAGENVAFVGHTGAGKTSIARLLARFYEFQEGKILVDDHDIRSFDLNQYRRQLGIVSQVPFLFSGTIAENIEFACPGTTEAEILNLANQIDGGKWVEALPHGIQTEVGERGAMLSMGQRQLVSLMRVVIQKPAIFILDEATANIDPFTESQIQQALALIMSKATSIIIAHRLSTVRSADRIIVVEKGNIIEEGNHEALLERGGHYSELYNTYFRHQSLEYVEQAGAFNSGRENEKS
jgi:ATP-binding cassette subfamily B protein